MDGVGGGAAGGVGALIALKRNHVMAVSHPAPAPPTLNQQQTQQQPQQHPEIIYEELPTDYSGHIEAAGEEECVSADATAAKRPKYVSEVL